MLFDPSKTFVGPRRWVPAMGGLPSLLQGPLTSLPLSDFGSSEALVFTFVGLSFRGPVSTEGTIGSG